MRSSHYDIVTVGGGLGSSSLAKAMAEKGKRVLILEREKQFRDRVRGEFMTPWGVAEAQELGIYELIRDSCGIDSPLTDLGFGPRHLPTTTPQQLPGLGFSHPEMQEVVLTAAQVAGAEIKRPATVVNIESGPTPTLTFQEGDTTSTVTTRLIVAADGRTSAARQWAGFEVHEQLHPFFFAGVLLNGVTIPEGQTFLLFLPPLASCTAVAPIGRGRCRTYVAYPENAEFRLQGPDQVPRFIAEARKAELISEHFNDVQAIGPLASFRCGDSWVEHPYRDGVVLLGDAASTSDPAFGQGLSTTVRDVRVLRDCLLADDDWNAAADAYAAEHDRYSAVIRKVEAWFRTIFLEQGDEADLRRSRALPLLAQDGTRAPDHLFSGPELPADESVKRRFFGED